MGKDNRPFILTIVLVLALAIFLDGGIGGLTGRQIAYTSLEESDAGALKRIPPRQEIYAPEIEEETDTLQNIYVPEIQEEIATLPGVIGTSLPTDRKRWQPLTLKQSTLKGPQNQRQGPTFIRQVPTMIPTQPRATLISCDKPKLIYPPYTGTIETYTYDAQGQLIVYEERLNRVNQGIRILDMGTDKKLHTLDDKKLQTIKGTTGANLNSWDVAIHGKNIAFSIHDFFNKQIGIMGQCIDAPSVVPGSCTGSPNIVHQVSNINIINDRIDISKNHIAFNLNDYTVGKKKIDIFICDQRLNGKKGGCSQRDTKTLVFSIPNNIKTLASIPTFWLTDEHLYISVRTIISSTKERDRILIYDIDKNTLFTYLDMTVNAFNKYVFPRVVAAIGQNYEDILYLWDIDFGFGKGTTVTLDHIKDGKGLLQTRKLVLATNKYGYYISQKSPVKSMDLGYIKFVGTNRFFVIGRKSTVKQPFETTNQYNSKNAFKSLLYDDPNYFYDDSTLIYNVHCKTS